MTDGPTTRRAALLLFGYLFVSFAYFLPGASWNPVSRYSLTRAIVEDSTLEVTKNVASTGDRAKVGQRYYSDKAPVPSLIAVPAYGLFHAVSKARARLPAFESTGTAELPAQRVIVSAAFRNGLWIGSLFSSGLMGAVLGVALFVVLARRVGRRTALIGSATTLLGTPLFAYSTSFFGHVVAGSFLFVAFALLDARGRPVSSRRVVGAGACLTLAAGSEYVVSIPAVLIVAYTVYAARTDARARVLGWLAWGAAAPAAVIGLYHWSCFGAPWRTGYTYVTHPAFAPGHATGLLGITYPRLDALWGILFGSSRGLFYVSPVCAVGLVGAVLAWRQSRDRSLALALAIVATMIAINASYYQWDGGWATGPRHVVPCLGFLGLGIGLAFTQPNLRPIAAALGGLSIAIMVLTTAVAIETPPRIDAVFDHLIPAVRRGEIARVSGASNLGLLVGLGHRASLLPIVVWIGGAGAALVWFVARSTPDGPSADDPKRQERD